MLASVESRSLPLNEETQTLYFTSDSSLKRVGFFLPAFKSKILSGNYLVDLLSFLKKLNFLGSELNLTFTLEKTVTNNFPFFPFICDLSKAGDFYFGVEGDYSSVKLYKTSEPRAPLGTVELWGKVDRFGMAQGFFLKRGAHLFSCQMLTNSFLGIGGINMKDVENVIQGEAEINMLIGKLQLPLFELFNLRKDSVVRLELPAELDVELRVGESVWRSAKLSWQGGEMSLKIS